jgi:hypothetical protein
VDFEFDALPQPASASPAIRTAAHNARCFMVVHTPRVLGDRVAR